MIEKKKVDEKGKELVVTSSLFFSRCFHKSSRVVLRVVIVLRKIQVPYTPNLPCLTL